MPNKILQSFLVITLSISFVGCSGLSPEERARRDGGYVPVANSDVMENSDSTEEAESSEPIAPELDDSEYIASVTVELTPTALYNRLKNVLKTVHPSARITSDDAIEHTFEASYMVKNSEGEYDDAEIEVTISELDGSSIVLYSYEVENTTPTMLEETIHTNITRTCELLKLTCSEPTRSIVE